MLTHTMSWLGLGLVLSALVGCAAPAAEPEEQKSTTSHIEGSGGPGTQFYAIPQGGSFDTGPIHFDSTYWIDAARDACGGDFSIDLSVQFSSVTDSTMTVDSVTATFHSGVDSTGAPNNVVPVNFSLFTRASYTSPPDVMAKSDGQTVVYPVNQTFTTERNIALVLEFGAAVGLPGGDSSDFACHNKFQAAFYPQGTFEGGE